MLSAGEGTHTDTYVDDLKQRYVDNPRIRFVGAVYGVDKHVLFQQAACFVLPSDIAERNLQH